MLRLSEIVNAVTYNCEKESGMQDAEIIDFSIFEEMPMWWLWWRTCAYCKLSLGKIDFLCEGCWEELEKKLRPEQKILVKNKLNLFSLWCWQGKDLRLQKFLLDLKGRRLSHARQRVLGHFVNLLKNLPAPQTVCCVVSREGRDHGLAMAEGFAKQYQCELVSLKLLQPKAHYKKLHRRERLQGRRVLANSTQNKQWEEPIWFVDDVLTTGATAIAVWEALGRPLDYRAVTMVYRAFERDQAD